MQDRVERLIAFRAYERRELDFMRAQLRPGNVVVDGGAHVGYYALHAAKIVGPSGAVHAFEPFPRNAERLRGNAALNAFQNISIREEALFDSSGQATFVVVDDPAETGWGSILIDATTGKHEIEIKTITLDDYSTQQDLERLDLIKLDVQGAEVNVIRGGAETIRRFKPLILCEAIDVYWGSKQRYTAKDLYAAMDELGYVGKPIPRAHPLNVMFVPR